MGTWGPKLYQDDVAEDIRSEYIEQLKHGKTNEDATKYVISNNTDYLSDYDDEPIFWFALADTQWEYGRLLPYVKEKALEFINNNRNIQRWSDNSQKEISLRQMVLANLKDKLNNKMPPIKKIRKYKLYKCSWSVGDTFAYELESNYAFKNGLDGRYLLITKVDECEYWPGHIIPIVTFKISKNNKIPKNLNELESLEYVKTFKSASGYGYVMKMISTSKRVIPNKKLNLIGKFDNLSRPSNEDYPHYDEMVACNWRDLEQTMIENYLYFTKKILE